jgi:lysyl-tRNA synthetase class 1
MPHLDVTRQIEKRKGAPLTERETRHLAQRIASARDWVERYARDEEKTHLQTELPARAHALTQTQRAFLHKLADALTEAAWDDERLQSTIFEAARLTPIDQSAAFKTIYRVLLDRDSGPKAGNLLAFLDRAFVITRFRELSLDKIAFWRESAVGEAELERWIAEQGAKIVGKSWTTEVSGSVAAFEILFEMQDGKKQLKRLLVEGTHVKDSITGLFARISCPPASQRV